MARRKFTHGGREYSGYRQISYLHRRTSRNSDYELWGTRYAHILIWQAHHGMRLDPEVFIIHHRDENKRNNTVCDDESGKCPVLNCGNLAPMTRADHIREHRPGRMGGRSIPNKAGARKFFCVNCNAEKSRRGVLCRECYLDSVTVEVEVA